MNVNRAQIEGMINQYQNLRDVLIQGAEPTENVDRVLAQLWIALQLYEIDCSLQQLVAKGE